MADRGPSVKASAKLCSPRPDRRGLWRPPTGKSKLGPRGRNAPGQSLADGDSAGFGYPASIKAGGAGREAGGAETIGAAERGSGSW